MGTNFNIASRVRGLGEISCGSGAPVRIIANIGTTLDTDPPDMEIKKAQAARQAGADIITDHSVGGDIKAIHRCLVENVPCQLSTVSVYETYVEAKRNGAFSPERAIKTFSEQAALGFDLITVHASILKEDLRRLAQSKRLIPSTSRGGMMVAEMMMTSGKENPYWTNFRDIVDISRKHGTVLSLGTSFRPGSILDTPDELYNTELRRMAQLVEIAADSGVGIMVEGIGHASLDVIPYLVRQAKTACHGVPYRVLCVACDSAIYRDHIASAVASSVAVAAGADLISAVSRSEHVRQPDISNIVEAVETAKIAAHCGDIARGGDTSLDENISRVRAETSCLARGAPAVLPRQDSQETSFCTMCGQFCALKIMRKIKEEF